MIGLKPFEQIGNNSAFQPALPTHSDQDRAVESSPGPASFDSLASGAIPREAIHQEGVLVHIPESAVPDHGGEAIVESNTTRDEGRPRAIAEDGYPVFINIVPRREVIHHVVDRGCQLGTTDELAQFGAGARLEELHS